MNARKLLEQVVSANAPWLLSPDPGARQAAMSCILAQADDYARHMPWLPSDKPVTPESERRRARRLNEDGSEVTAARRAVLGRVIG